MALAAIVQAPIDALTAQGINKIIIVSQLQELENETKLISFLRDVDVVIAGGSNTLLSDSNDVLRPGDISDGEYAQIITNADGDADRPRQHRRQLQVRRPAGGRVRRERRHHPGQPRSQRQRRLRDRRRRPRTGL